MKRSVTDIKLTVKPVFIGFEHQYYYEGPCRMAGGDAIKPGFDAVVQGKMLKGFLANVDKYVASTGANVLEPAIVRGTDDWDIKDSYFEEMLADDQKTDLYVVMSNFGANQILVEFCCRTSKPVVMNPTKSFGAMSTAPAQRRGADILPAFDWPEVSRYCSILRAEKAVRTANILLAPRFDSTTPKAGGNDSFTCLSDVTRQLGCHFRHVNVHELMDMMNPLPEEGNATTPGRATPNITPEEVARCEEMADEMVASADPCIVDKGFLVKSLVAWTVVQKLMDLYDCSGFTAPCPDACSTRRRADQAREFVYGVEDLFHLVLGLKLRAQPVAVAGDGVHQPLRRAVRAQDLAALGAVLVRIALKVDVVQQAHDRPEVALPAVAQRVGKAAHHRRDRHRVAQVEGLGVVFAQQREGRIIREFHADASCGGACPPVFAV